MKYLTIGEVGNRIACQANLIRKAIKKGILPEPPRVGVMRAYLESDVEKVKTALVAAGYLAPREEAMV